MLVKVFYNPFPFQLFMDSAQHHIRCVSCLNEPSVRISTSTPTCSLRRLPTVRLGYVSISGWNVSENASFIMTRTLRSICVVLVIPTPNPARISASLRKNSIPVSTSRNSIRRALRTTGTSATTTRWSVRPLFQRQGQGAAQLRGTAPKHLG